MPDVLFRQPAAVHQCQTGTCTRLDTRMYATGHQCPDHTPAALKGDPEPGRGRYCAPGRCYCGACPWWSPVNPYNVIEHTIVDVRAVASGRRRASIESFRAAQAELAARRTP